jgi:hypothetical protein
MQAKITDIPFIIIQATTCLRAAQTCTDHEISERLLDLAGAFADCARRLGADPDAIPNIDRPDRSGRCGEVES